MLNICKKDKTNLNLVCKHYDDVIAVSYTLNGEYTLLLVQVNRQ